MIITRPSWQYTRETLKKGETYKIWFSPKATQSFIQIGSTWSLFQKNEGLKGCIENKGKLFIQDWVLARHQIS